MTGGFAFGKMKIVEKESKTIMSRTVKCAKLGQELEGVEKKMLTGELGQRVYDSISKQAWDMWVQHQTMLINEYRLNLGDPNAKKFLLQEAEKFFFGDEETERPPDYVPPAQ